MTNKTIHGRITSRTKRKSYLSTLSPSIRVNPIDGISIKYMKTHLGTQLLCRLHCPTVMDIVEVQIMNYFRVDQQNDYYKVDYCEPSILRN